MSEVRWISKEIFVMFYALALQIPLKIQGGIGQSKIISLYLVTQENKQQI